MVPLNPPPMIAMVFTKIARRWPLVRVERGYCNETAVWPTRFRLSRRTTGFPAVLSGSIRDGEPLNDYDGPLLARHCGRGAQRDAGDRGWRRFGPGAGPPFRPEPIRGPRNEPGDD